MAFQDWKSPGVWKHPKSGFSCMECNSHNNSARSEKDKITMNVCEEVKATQERRDRQVSCENLKLTEDFPIHKSWEADAVILEEP